MNSRSSKPPSRAVLESSSHRTAAECGFALVSTLLLMVLLGVLAVGLLSLSSVCLRTSSQTSAESEARANARLALMLAIGELQKQTGPDQRVSASGAILDTLKPDGTVDVAAINPHWTGVWNSWKAGTGENSQHSTIGNQPDIAMRPTRLPYAPNQPDPGYETDPGRPSYFRSWLLSLNPGEASEILNARDLVLDPANDPDVVQLVGPGSLGAGADASDFVSARLLTLNPSASGKAFRGRYGWWVGDESQKARLMGDSHVTNPDPGSPLPLASRLSRQQAPGSMGTRSIKGLQNITAEQQLGHITSLKTLDLVSVDPKPDDDYPKVSQLNFHHATPFSYQVLADVREGGLKRDLSTLLERPINIAESLDDFMLYKFNASERVPIQDLAAYFQLYHQAAGDPAIGNKGVRYASSSIANGIQITTPDYGGASAKGKFHRQYTALYRSPVPIKLQFFLGLSAELVDDKADIYELYLTISLGMTLWNPTNLPLVMDNSASARLFQRIRLWDLAMGIQWEKINNGWTHDADLKTILGDANLAMDLDISRDVPLIFAPGEVKVLSIPYSSAKELDVGGFDTANQAYALYEGWDPEGFMRTARSASVRTAPKNIKSGRVLFTPGDQIRLTINAISGSSRQPIRFQLGQDSFPDTDRGVGTGRKLEPQYYNYTLSSRDSDIDRASPKVISDGAAFKNSFMMRGVEGNTPFRMDLPLATIISNSANKETWPFLSFALMAGSETSESANASGMGGAGGRKFASRPFLHSSAIRPSMMDADTANAFYNYGWNWWIEPINSILEASLQVTPNGKNGFYGGGYGPGSGSTHIVQQEIPVVPPMSIASLSHAHLGGYSLSDIVPRDVRLETVEPLPLATGRGGLFPHTLQAIGNSYAHPLLPAGAAYDATFQRTFQPAYGPKTVVFADHSYLANKALWDEFFFSSITPQPASVEAFGGAGRTARQVAGDFFFHHKPLPNRRITPYIRRLDEPGLDMLFTKANDFRDGLADQIAAHLLIEGPFNVNSTSVEAWKALLASLKGKPVAYLDKDRAKHGVTNPDVAETTGTPVASFNMPNAIPGPGSSDPKDPGQWLGWRELNDTEIQELAAAIVRQVKRRGPFLSLSEFVNRRLDASDPGLSVKGALQAALDDPAVSINAGFRTPEREFSAAEKLTMTPAFPAALDGPVAYGSAAYVDQADVLRNFSAQLTPRGDTFVIRTYGDAMDAQGNVVARAWCEAVVQRVPDYYDPSLDEPYEKFSDLAPVNQTFGRKFVIVSFRWLNAKEV